MKTANLIISFLLILGFTSNAFGSSPSPSANGQKGIINVLSPEPMGIGRLSVSGFMLFGASALYNNDDNYKGEGSATVYSSSLSDYFQSTSHLGISYGLTDYIDLNARFGLAIDKRRIDKSQTPDTTEKKLWLIQPNNLELGIKYAIWKKSAVKMGFNLFAHIPIVEKLTGDNSYFKGYQRNFSEELLYTQKVGYGAKILASIGSKGMKTYLNIGYTMHQSELISDAFTGGVGFEIIADEMTTVWGEFDSEYYLSSPKISPMRLGGGLRFNMPYGIQLTSGAFAGINDEAPVWQGILGISWSGIVVTFDSDNDGIVDKLDKCPNTPEDKDGFEDEDGCPDLDNDKDGILDTVDKCPNKPEDKDGFEDKDGCPEEDNDKDGILDIDDKCPNEAEDVDGFEDIDGCPDLDNDKDGILDSLDKCPNKPEDKDGFEDKDGCPDLDNDKDGILDTDDKCPNKAETINGFEDEDGCPDKVLLKKNQKILLDNIYFKSGKAELTIDSFTALDKVKRIFVDNPNVKIQIEGHTDSQGSARSNLKLSQRRANTVMNYIINKLRVNASQLKAVGFGEEHPIASNKTKEGRTQNRRIEFKVLSNK